MQIRGRRGSESWGKYLRPNSNTFIATEMLPGRLGFLGYLLIIEYQGGTNSYITVFMKTHWAGQKTILQIRVYKASL